MKRLDNHHYIAIEWLAQPRHGGKTIKEIADICEVHEQSVYYWLKDDLFNKELKKAMVRQRQDKLPQLIDSIYDHAIHSGNAAMAKLALQVNDMLSDSLKVETSAKQETVDYDVIDHEIDDFNRRIGAGEEN